MTPASITPISETVAATAAQLDAGIRPFLAPSRPTSIAQIITSFGGFIASSAAIYALVTLVSPWWLVLAPVAAGFLVRIFIIQHDCGHGAFFQSKRANDIVGYACSLMTLAPYASWRRQHAGHHGVWNDLDRRDRGVDIYSTCLTVAEYEALSPGAKFWHRLSHHPVLTHLVLPPLVFFVLYRLPFDMPASWRRERRALLLTNLALVGLYGGLGLLLGFDSVIAVSAPIMALASIIGVWLFGVQHRFEGVHWARHDDWNATEAALRGSSYLRLPRVLQWFTGNIGFHHLHHLNSRIPNYRLEACHRALPQLSQVKTLTFWDALLRAPRFMLWDEERRAMVTIAQAG